MSLDRQDVQKIARLARLRIDPERADEHAHHLSDILHLVEQMNAVDTDHIEPMAHPRDSVLRLRDDVVSEPDRRDDFLALAPASEAGLFLVPKVIE